MHIVKNTSMAIFFCSKRHLRAVAPKFEHGKQLFFEIGVLKHFSKFTGKHLCRSLFFNKVF